MAPIFKTQIVPSSYDKDWLARLYGMMVRIRKFDENLIRLMNEGKVSGFYHSGIGSEAVSASSIANLRDDDYLFYNHRGCNQMIAKGVPLAKLYGDFLGTLEGTTRGLGAGIVHSADLSRGVMGQAGTIGSQLSISLGTAYSSKWNGNDRVTAVYFGEGAASEEAFHGAMNWAALYKLPIIFICENNQYAISSHWRETHAVREHIADWADGYGIPNLVVDGNDALLMYEATREAVERARGGGGPTFIEAETFRHRGHFEGDPFDYVDPVLMKEWVENRDPVKNFRALLEERGALGAAALTAIEEATDAEVAAAIDLAEAAPLPPRERIFEGLYS
ncbi:thiamine pyrophosphate-dependent dehydrogenase E1 component subunit alpha [Rhodobacter sp. 24-YEA-8]|uniref:thiamine pyrophosphate-dependent dehydrogenase E1 component subunit alpha n=1 Tax=Rhodobacter sp. 24-YEA-8 TaxID=1884310 RepID=UPI00089C4357|nr:thiamine pyrophosphate-dependent dehydrogenase E1 component subunit alpha [Rhodobacter sp. 24-YEA-8]SED16513.1 pyruvate dehydrogenase E1 component alpha subunit [Rhodobacter sp. 24-YEA-8]